MEDVTLHWCLKRKKMKYKITSFVHIRNQGILLEGREIFSFSKSSDAGDFLKKAYTALNISYPKFHKMDVLCKLGILASEVLFRNHEISPDTALVFSIASSCLETDKDHREEMNGIVSPAIFVYTLPNIVLGEISIKHKLQSENVFFVSEKFNAPLIKDYTTVLLENSKVPAVVCGWIEWKNAEYDVFLCLVSPEGKINFNRENLEELYYFENERSAN